jgi:hypothetical protein
LAFPLTQKKTSLGGDAGGSKTLIHLNGTKKIIQDHLTLTQNDIVHVSVKLKSVRYRSKINCGGYSKERSVELTKYTFENFISRLRYHHQGDGVKYHYTRDPLFIVQKRERIYGFDSDYVSDYVWINAEQDHAEADERTARRLDALDDDFRDTGQWEKIYYADRWEYVCSHLTKEGADAFIRRKGHDYKDLRVYVECQIHCEEYNAIINGLLDGKIAFTVE